MSHVGLNKLCITRQGSIAFGLTLLLALILLTPYCGYLFACGCTWPWYGLALNCNYFTHTRLPHCPWCVSPLTSGTLIALALLVSALVSYKLTALAQQRFFTLTASVFVGTSLFLFILSMLAVVFARMQNYPGLVLL